jgi:hypothetical protein
MKRVSVLVLLVLMILVTSVLSFAHPAVPEQSLQKISPNAANGMHTAVMNLPENGIAKHVFEMRFNPH